jgi:hypothetical protein
MKNRWLSFIFALLLIGVLLTSMMACAPQPYINPTDPAVQQAAVQAQSTLIVSQAQVTAQAASAAATTTQQALEIAREEQRARATATAMALQEQQRVVQATATAEAIYFSHNATATAAAWAIQATATADTLRANATAQAATAERIRLDTERARLIYPLTAYGPWVAAGVALLFVVWAGVRLVLAAELQQRVIRADARGDAGILVLRQGKRMVVYDPDLALQAAMVIGQDGKPTMPALVNAAQQAQIKQRDQALALIHRGLPSAAQRQRRPTANQAAALLAPPPRAITEIEVLSPDDPEVRPWLAEVTPLALETTIIDVLPTDKT